MPQNPLRAVNPPTLEVGHEPRSVGQTTIRFSRLILITMMARQVLREVLAGVDGEVIASLLRDALEAYAAGGDDGEHRPSANGGK